MFNTFRDSSSAETGVVDMEAETQPFDDPTLEYEVDEEMEDFSDKDEQENEKEEKKIATSPSGLKKKKKKNDKGPWN